MTNSKLIIALTDFSQGKKVETFGTKLNAIEHHATWGKLKRIFNEGRGLLEFAQMDENTLLVNECLLTKKEIKDIKENLKVSYEIVFLGYPDYYSKGLKNMRK